MKATAVYSVKRWDEHTYQRISPHKKMTRAEVEYEMHGDIDCTANVQYLMYYQDIDDNDKHKSRAAYVGLMKLDGKIGDKSGTFALEDEGEFEAGAANSSLKIIEGSGTGDFKNIKGTARYRADNNKFTFELEYTLH